MGSQLVTKSFTVEEYERMTETGILAEDDRVELIEGMIIEMTPIGSRHAACVARLTHLLTQRLGNQAIVWVQNPVRLSRHSEPQPDLALLRPRHDFYAGGHPEPADVQLLIEVADASLETDRTVKVPLYAKAGIPETWVVDLEGGRVEVFRGPNPDGYESVRAVPRGESVAPEAFPVATLAVGDLLPYALPDPDQA
jgi:Uma2 family endonuclease